MYSLFEVFGVEMEFMIVDRETLQAKPVCDEIIREMTGSFTADVERGAMAWSNELVSHVIEVKTNGPAKHLAGLGSQFHEEVKAINDLLKPHNAMLLSTGAHPFFNPEKETKIWPHEYNEVYSLYDRIFGCKGHGWSNLQSTHINLPFSNDEEFALLHSAIRLILPIIPSIAASTPILDGTLTGFKDARLEHYRHNQERFPVISGHIVPEHIVSKQQYQEVIFNPIIKAIAPYDKDGILDKHFLNSRGAIARFDRGAVEIRVIDIQECPSADIAILEWIVAGIKWLIEHKKNELLDPTFISTSELSEIFIHHIRHADDASISNPVYAQLFNLKTDCSSFDIWRILAKAGAKKISDESLEIIEFILGNGSLSSRILRILGQKPDASAIKGVYEELANCLAENRVFV